MRTGRRDNCTEDCRELAEARRAERMLADLTAELEAGEFAESLRCVLKALQGGGEAPHEREELVAAWAEMMKRFVSQPSAAELAEIMPLDFEFGHAGHAMTPPRCPKCGRTMELRWLMSANHVTETGLAGPQLVAICYCHWSQPVRALDQVAAEQDAPAAYAAVKRKEVAVSG